MAIITLTTRESIQTAVDVAGKSRRRNDAVDRANEAASEAITEALHRDFRPWYGTRSFPWPHPDAPSSTWRLWLGRHELLELDALTIAGSALTSTQWLLEPTDGPPFDEIQLNEATYSGSFSSGDSSQRSIVATGLFGFTNDEQTTGATAETMNASTDTVEVTAAASSKLGVGDLIRIDTERMRITDRSYVDTGDTLTTALTATKAETSIDVADGTTYAIGEVLVVDDEAMYITGTAATSITVERSYRGALAAHEIGASITADRLLEVDRGDRGSTAATHTSAAAIYRHRVPRLIDQLAVVEALVELGIGKTGAAPDASTGASASDAGGAGAAGLWKRAHRAYGRHGRMTAVGS